MLTLLLTTLCLLLLAYAARLRRRLRKTEELLRMEMVSTEALRWLLKMRLEKTKEEWPEYIYDAPRKNEEF